MPSELTAKYDWILALTTIAFIFASAGNGANDVANSYATSVAARTMTMSQAGILAFATEFIGAVAMGSRVTDTIKNGVISIDRYQDNPGVLMLVMGCAEVANACWLTLATIVGFPVSTTQTIVGCLIGVGFASESPISWGWKKGSVSQIAASWGIAPAVAGGFSAVIFGVLKYTVLERKDPFKWALRLIPVYIAFTCAILALFITIEAPTAPSLEEFGGGKITGIILAVFFGMLILSFVFFLPYVERRLIMKDPRVKWWHIPMGPLLRKENPHLYFPSKDTETIIDYYSNAYGHVSSKADNNKKESDEIFADENLPNDRINEEKLSRAQLDISPTLESCLPSDSSVTRRDTVHNQRSSPSFEGDSKPATKPIIGPSERFIGPVKGLSWLNPLKWWGYIKFILLQGVTRDVISHNSDLLRDIHSRARQYDIRVEHLWTYCQVLSAIMMSIAHGSNDVANAVGPWSAVYRTYQAGEVETSSSTPVWFLVVAGALLGLGFWVYGYNIMRCLGNRITQMSPTRGFSIELGAAISVLLASRLGLPVSTTQCLTGAALGVALMNYDIRAVNWRQLAWIFLGWVITLPAAGLISGLICLMALNTPHF